MFNEWSIYWSLNPQSRTNISDRNWWWKFVLLMLTIAVLYTACSCRLYVGLIAYMYLMWNFWATAISAIRIKSTSSVASVKLCINSSRERIEALGQCRFSSLPPPSPSASSHRPLLKPQTRTQRWLAGSLAGASVGGDGSRVLVRFPNATSATRRSTGPTYRKPVVGPAADIPISRLGISTICLLIALRRSAGLQQQQQPTGCCLSALSGSISCVAISWLRWRLQTKRTQSDPRSRNDPQFSLVPFSVAHFQKKTTLMLYLFIAAVLMQSRRAF